MVNIAWFALSFLKSWLSSERNSVTLCMGIGLMECNTKRFKRQTQT